MTGLHSATNGCALSALANEGSHSVAKPELGLKRHCMNCGAKFYDLNRDPILCPKCGTVFQASALTRAAAPVVARAAPGRDEEDTEVETAGPEMVSLEDIEVAENEKDPALDDVGDDATDEPFLEEEEESEDDVSGLIDGDIENDEEA